MVGDAVIYIELVAAIVVFFLVIFADCCALFQGSFVEYLGVNVLETLGQNGEVRDRVTAMGYSCLEVVFSEDLVEPDCKIRIANSRTAKSIEFCNFNFVGEEMSGCMSSQSSS